MILIILSGVIIGCSSEIKEPAEDVSPLQDEEKFVEKYEQEKEDPIMTKIEKMTLEERINNSLYRILKLKMK